jgi:hypothetical protein
MSNHLQQLERATHHKWEQTCQELQKKYQEAVVQRMYEDCVKKAQQKAQRGVSSVYERYQSCGDMTYVFKTHMFSWLRCRVNLETQVRDKLEANGYSVESNDPGISITWDLPATKVRKDVGPYVDML